MQVVKPDYAGACVVNLVPHLVGGRFAEWFPEPVRGAERIVLLVLDGLGWNLLRDRAPGLPTLGTLPGAEITTVTPSTTPVAMTSITTGLPPAVHGIVGYRMRLPQGVFNLIRWKIHGGRTDPPDPDALQPRDAFEGQDVPVVSRRAFEDTGFTRCHLRGARYFGWHTTSGIVEHCRELVAAGERFIFAYYDGPDLVSHIYGLEGRFIAAELTYCDRLVADLLDVLPDDVGLLVTADHGHVPIAERVGLEPLHPMVDTYAQEARFRYLYARSGARQDLLEAARELCGDRGRVFTCEELCEDGWLGPEPPSDRVRARVGDVVLAAEVGVGFDDPTNPGETKLVTGHGGITPDEMLVPLLGARGRA